MLVSHVFTLDYLGFLRNMGKNEVFDFDKVDPESTGENYQLKEIEKDKDPNYNFKDDYGLTGGRDEVLSLKRRVARLEREVEKLLPEPIDKNSSFCTNVNPCISDRYDLGEPNLQWRNGFFGNDVAVSGNVTIQENLLFVNLAEQVLSNLYYANASCPLATNYTFCAPNIVTSGNNSGVISTVKGTANEINSVCSGGTCTVSLTSPLIPPGNVNPAANGSYTLGNATDQWDTLFVDQIYIGGNLLIPLNLGPAFAVVHGSNCTQDDTPAIEAAINKVINAGLGGGVVFFPPGCYSVTAPNAGIAITLNTSASNIAFTGASRESVTIKPNVAATHYITCFSIRGASNTRFAHLSFNNAGNTLTGSTAIGQTVGPSLTVEDCYFSSFGQAIQYTGNSSNVQQLSGDFKVSKSIFVSCSFGMLPAQPETIQISDVQSRYTQTGSDGKPPHLLYVTNPPGAQPNEITVVNVIDYMGNSSALKIRKGRAVTVTNVAVLQSGRGVEVWNAPRLTISNLSIRLAENATGYVAHDGLRTALEITNCGDVSVSNVVIDASNTTAHSGVRLRYVTTNFVKPKPSTSYASFGLFNTWVRVSDVTVIYDNNLTPPDPFSPTAIPPDPFTTTTTTTPTTTTTTYFAPFTINSQFNALFEGLRAQHIDNVAGSVYPIAVSNCTNCTFFRPIHWAPENPSDSYKLISFDNDTNYNTLIFWDQDIWGGYQSGHSGSINDNSVGLKFLRANYGNVNGYFLAGSPGTAALPAISFYPQQDSGLYRAATNELGISAGGVSVATFSNSEIILEEPTTAPSYGGEVNANFSLGNSDVVGVGATVACAANHGCTSVTGQITITTGVNITNSGTFVTINTGVTRTNHPNPILFWNTSPTPPAITYSGTTTTVALAVSSVLLNSTTYIVSYWLGGI